MSNLQSAELAITAEITLAKAGVAHYQSRVDALENALAQLVNVDAASGVTPSVTKEPKQPKTKTVTLKPAKQKKSKASKAAAGVSDLPFTGGDYWPNLLTNQHQSSKEILQKAVDHLGFAPTKDQIKKLVGRMTFALNTLVKEKKIQDAGAGRARRFFKA